MLSRFEKKAVDFSRANNLFSSCRRVLLAFSGGTDSTALLYTIAAMKDEGKLQCEVICAHINHRLRGSQATEDERFVIERCAELSFPVEIKSVDVRGYASEKKLSIETAGRQIRIESLLSIARREGCSCVATGHQKDDNAETILHRLARGTGYRGLGGIWPVKEFKGGVRFVRPLLSCRRKEIIDYLKRRQINWQVDRTNVDCSYRRNFIRHKLLPVLEQDSNVDIVEVLFELSQVARRLHFLICDTADKIWPALAESSDDNVTVQLEEFLRQPKAVQVELVRRGLVMLGSGERDLSRGHYNRILQLAEKRTSGKKIELPGGFIVYRDYKKLLFTQGNEDFQIKDERPESRELVIGGQTSFGDYLIDARISEAEDVAISRLKIDKDEFVEWFDLDRVILPLIVRFRRDGDRFVPLGLAKEKKVGKFLTDAKVPQRIRKRVLIISDNEKVIWVCPIRISEEAGITAKTQKIIRLKIIDNNP